MYIGIDIGGTNLKAGLVDEAGNRVDEGRCVFFVGVGQPDSRTEALTGHASVRVAL